jgi:tetratricopeptide (TPR) repeat protein
VTATKVAAWRDDVALWTAALVADRESVVPRYNLAAARARAGDLDGAQAALRGAAARFPDDPHVAALGGWIAELRGEPSEALHQYERAIALGVRDASLFRQAALLAAGVGDRERAARWFATAAPRFPRAAWSHIGLAWSLEREGRPDRARAHLLRAEELAPQAAERPWFLGRLRAADGDVAEAARSYREALRLDPLFLPAHRDLALLAERAGRLGEAARHWRRIADAAPDPDRHEALAHLRRLETAAAGAPPAGRP